tara:strand:- start:145 stop:477 length:333 start_codon:yes stop_codon:yes gene_type:complete
MKLKTLCVALLSLTIVVVGNQAIAKELLIFGADWCPSCVKLKNFVNKTPNLFKKFKEVKIINIDKHPELKKELSITKIPTSVIFSDDGKIDTKKTGFSQTQYIDWLKNNE